MCSFLLTISNKDINKKCLLKANHFIKSRGPNHTNFLNFKSKDKEFNAVHNLLDISGFNIIQPIFKDLKNLLLFNGEIYSTPKSLPDTLSLYNHLQKNSLLKFLKKSRGEYAICTVNLENSLINLYTDLIGTKPLFYGYDENKICVSSYEKPLKILNIRNIFEVIPNNILEINFNNFANLKIKEDEIYKLDINQYVNNFTLWEKAFFQSVKEKATHFNSRVIVPLSSGYDSGAICCALNKQNIPYETITVGDAENKNILKKRIKINKEHSCLNHIQIAPISKEKSNNISSFLKDTLGNIIYSHIDGDNSSPISLHQDGGAIGLLCLCKEMSKKRFNVILSGSGADEIISDYGFNGEKIYEHSEFGGLFPNSLEGFFPWKKFYGDTQRSYLKKDEMVAGIFGIEGRYPFLDIEVIQNFLNLSASLKNKEYKSCLAYLLDLYDYPYNKGTKDGFYPEKSQFNFFQKVYRKLKIQLKIQ